MTLTFGDWLLVAVVVCGALAAGAPLLASYLHTRKMDRLAAVVDAGGRIAAVIVTKLRALPPNVSKADAKKELIAQGVEQLRSPALFGGTIKREGYADEGLKALVGGKVAQMEIAAPVPVEVVNNITATAAPIDPPPCA